MKSKKKFETLAQRIETTLVNGTRATVSISKQYLKTSQNLNEGISPIKIRGGNSLFYNKTN